MTQYGAEPRQAILHAFGLCDFGLHTQVPCINRGSTWSEDPRTSPPVAGAWRSADTALLSDCCPSLSSVSSVGFSSPCVTACRCLDHNFLNGMRVGEASHPGPQPMTGPRQEEQQVTPHIVAYPAGFDMGQHTQVPCSDRGSIWSKGRSKSPTEARTCRSACSDFSVACRSSSSPALSLNHNFLNGMRIGEASNSNPGPQPNAGLQAFTQQAVQQALQQALAGLDLGALLSGVVAVPQAAPTAAPPGSRAQPKKGQDQEGGNQACPGWRVSGARASDSHASGAQRQRQRCTGSQSGPD